MCGLESGTGETRGLETAETRALESIEGLAPPAAETRGLEGAATESIRYQVGMPKRTDTCDKAVKIGV